MNLNVFWTKDINPYNFNFILSKASEAEVEWVGTAVILVVAFGVDLCSVVDE